MNAAMLNSLDAATSVGYQANDMELGMAPEAPGWFSAGAYLAAPWIVSHARRGYPLGASARMTAGPRLPRGLAPGRRWLGLRARDLGAEYGKKIEGRIWKSAISRSGRRGLRGFASAFSGTVGRGAAVAMAGRGLLLSGNIAFLAPLALDLGRAAGAGLAHLGVDRGRLDFGSTMIDTEQAQTQRQAGLMAIHDSQLQTRSWFMREAEAFHR